MLRFVTVFAAAAAFALADPVPHNVFEIDISPEEAQKYLNSPPFTEPQLSGRTGVLPLVRFDSPNFRSAEAGPTLGHYWKNGHEIENTDDYVEEVYDASQFHGQDGLGAYTYGYRAPESSKVENRVGSGDVTGSYTYKSGNNELIKVRYWADSEGFHQEDNIPKVELKQVEEAEDVRQARLAHEKAWQEAAAAAAQQPDPQYVYKQLAKIRGEYNGAKYDQYQGSPSEPQRSFASGSQQHASYATAPQQQSSFAAGSQQQGSFASASEPQASFAAASEPQGSFAAAPEPQGSFAAASEQQAQVAAPREGKAYANAQVQSSYQNAQQFGKYGQQSSFGQGQQQQQFGQGQQQQLGQSSQYNQKQQYQQSGQFGQQGGQYGQQSGYGQQHHEKVEEPEPTGPPRGFFYSFDYPVSIIVRKDAQGQNGPVSPGQPVDHDTVQQG